MIKVSKGYYIAIHFFCIFVVGTSVLNAQTDEYDTLYLKKYDVAIYNDTLFFSDEDSSQLIIEKGVKYRVRSYKEKYYKFIRDNYRGLVKTTGGKEGEISEDAYKPYIGKIIRSIFVKRVDLLEGDVNDTTIVATSSLYKALNKLHTHTSPYVIKKNLRFKPFDRIEAGILAENERLLRGLSFIEAANIFVVEDTLSADSVDVYVVTKDNFPLGVGLDYNSFSNFILEVYDRNFIGAGHDLSVLLEYNRDSSSVFGYGFRLEGNNILGSFVNTRLEFLQLTGRKQLAFTINKPFLTNDVKYGGETTIRRTETVLKWNEYEADTVINNSFLFNSDVIDIWLGRSLYFSKSDRSKFLNVGARFEMEQFNERPTVEPDTNQLFHNRFTFLGNLTFRKVNYFKTSKITSFGVTEDVPYGYFFQFTGGYQEIEFFRFPYYGITLALGKKFRNLGYLLLNFGAGGYPYKNRVSDFRMGFRALYYSPLFKIGKFELRNIFNPSFISIENPLYQNPLNFDKRIRGLNQSFIFGESYLAIRYEAFFYTPLNVAGFKTAFSLFGDSGWITERSYLGGNREFFGAYGIGWHIKNESLTIPAFTVQLAYYPKLKFRGDQFGVTFRFQDFRIFRNLQQLKPNFYFDWTPI